MAITAGDYLVGTGASSSFSGYDGGYETWAAAAADCASQTLTGPLTFYQKDERLSATQVTFNPVTTDANYLKLTYAPGAFHGGFPNTGARFHSTSGSGFGCFVVNVEDLIVDGLCLSRDGGSSQSPDYPYFRITTAGTSRTLLFQNCVFVGDEDGEATWGGFWLSTSGSGVSASTMPSVRFENCIGVNCAGFSGFASPNNTVFQAYHCTLLARLTNFTSIARSGFRNGLCKNCFSGYWGGLSSHKNFLDMGTGFVTNGATDDSGTSSGLDNLDLTDTFEDGESYPWDLRPKSGSALLSAGTGSVLSTDILGASRNGSTPTIGAFENVPSSDVTAPTYSAGPSQTAVTTTTASFTATASDETDSVVDHALVVVADGATAPTATQVFAGLNGSGSAALATASQNGVSNGAAWTPTVSSGIDSGTPYDVYFSVKDSTGNKSTPTKVDITTLAALTSATGTPDTTTGPTGNTADLSVATTGNSGTLYWYISTSATPPSVADLKAGTGANDFGNQAVSASGTQTVSNQGSLNEETNYYVHFLHTFASQDSAIATSAAFNPGTDAPTLSNATGSVASATSASLSVDTNRVGVGTLWVVVTTSATQPSPAQIKAGQNHLGAAAAYAANDTSVTSPQTFTATGLVSGTGYFAHFYQEDAGSDASNRITSNSFTPVASGVYNIDGFSPATIRPGDTVTANISGNWSGSGMTGLLDGHPITLTAQSASQVQFTAPSLHTNPTFVDTQYGIPQVFQLNDGSNNQTKTITISPPSGYDFVQIASTAGIWANDEGAGINDDHLGHWTAGSADPITNVGVLNNIAGFPATYEYWRFDESEQVWTTAASETFYETPRFDGPAYVAQTFYVGVAISTQDYSAGFNEATAAISAFAEIADNIPGLSLNTSTGALTGTPTTFGVYQYVVRAADSESNFADSNTISITVLEAPVWSGAPSNQIWAEGAFVSLTLADFVNGNGFGPAASFAQTGGTLPSGVTLNTTTGVVSGTVALGASASSPFNGQDFSATNTSGTGAMPGTFNITVTVALPTFIGTIASIGPIASNAAMTPVDVSGEFAGGAGTFSFVGTPPTGVTIDSAGVISGTPTVFGTYPNLRVRKTNASGTVDSGEFTITVSAAAPTFTGSIANISTAFGVAMTPVNAALQFGGGPATSWSLTGTPPDGVTINTSTGVISGVPVLAGVFTGLKVRKTNPTSFAESNAFSITVVGNLPAVVSNPPNLTNYVDDVINIDFTTYFTGETLVEVTGLPDGLTDTAGVVTGTLTTDEAPTVTVTASNAAGEVERTFVWTVLSAAPALVTNIPNLVRSASRGVSIDIAPYFVGQAPVTYAVTAGALPTGLTLSAAGIITGIVLAPDVETGIEITATNSAGDDTSNAFSFTIKTPTTGGGMMRMGVGI